MTLDIVSRLNNLRTEYLKAASHGSGVIVSGPDYSSAGSPYQIWAYQRYRQDLYETFRNAGQNPVLLAEAPEGSAGRQALLPEIQEELRRQNENKLPYAAASAEAPFSVSSKNFRAKLVKVETGGEPLYALQVTDKTKNRHHHACIININGDPYAFPVAHMQTLRDEVRDELLFMKPVHFYLHVPPERAEGGREVFREIFPGDALSMNPDPRDENLSVLPAGIDLAIRSFYTCRDALSLRNPVDKQPDAWRDSPPDLYYHCLRYISNIKILKELKRDEAFATLFNFKDSQIPIVQYNNGHEDYRDLALGLHMREP